jgi:thiol:disulfide interchange protein DsbD
MQYARLARFATLLLMIIGAASTVALAAAPRPANEVFQFGVQTDDQREGINLIWKIAPGYYLYRDRISGTLNGKKLQIVTSRGEIKDDPTFWSHRDKPHYRGSKHRPELSSG